MRFTPTVVSALAGAIGVAAHGFIDSVIIDGLSYRAYDPRDPDYNPSTMIAWTSDATDRGFVSPDAYQDPDIICHRGSENAAGYAEIEAGDSLFVQWKSWPVTHRGPVIDYLASCGDESCSSVDKNTLEFFKIGEVGLLDGSTVPVTMGDSLLQENGEGWMVTIPATLAPGHYVLRHEIIALHMGGQLNGAQNYPYCFSLKVTGSGSARPQGVLGTKLYTAEDKGIHFGIFRTADSYEIPGPALYSGSSPVKQTSSVANAIGTPTVGNGPAPTTRPSVAQGNNKEVDAITEAPPVPSAPAPTATTPKDDCENKERNRKERNRKERTRKERTRKERTRKERTRKERKQGKTAPRL